MANKFPEEFLYAPHGFRDYPPLVYRYIKHLIEIMETIPQRYGYELYDGPIVERRALYEVKSGGEIVGEVFEVKGKSEEKLVLRPEMTPTLGRLIARLDQELTKPIRWATISRYFRDETPQRGRVKEFWQLNVDIIGLESPYADAEVIRVLYEILREAGLKDGEFQILINDRRIIEAILIALGIKNIELVFPILDKKDKLLQEHIRKLLEKSDLLDSEIEQIALMYRKYDRYKDLLKEKYGSYQIIGEIGSNLKSIRREAFVSFLVSQGIAEEDANILFDVSEINGHPDEALPKLVAILEELGASADSTLPLQEAVEYLKDMGVGNVLVLDASIVRGFAYYTGIIFEAFDAESLIPRAVAGGGRYDDLVSVLGGSKIPATGFGMGETVLLEILKEKGRFGEVKIGVPDIAIKPLGKDLVSKAHEIATNLRRAGLNVLFIPPMGKLGKSFEHASKRGVQYFLILGKKDLENEQITLRDIVTGDQKVIALEKLVEEILKILR